MRRDAGFTKFISGILIPVCIWGMVSSLLMLLVDMRSLFIEGGEWRMKQGVISFTLGVILLQRLRRMMGRNTALGYGFALGAAITLFAAFQANAYDYPVHPFLVFLANEAIFAALWWSVHNITAACWRDEPVTSAAAAETGILAKRKKLREKEKEKKEELTEEERQKQWSHRLSGKHPGRVILYFALFALPAFGLGVYMFGPDHMDLRLRLGIYVFAYLWFTFCLLFLSSLSRLALYFEKRKVSLPENVGIPWIAIGFFVVTLALGAAFFLPQPPSEPGIYVKSHVVASYKGLFHSEHGVQEGTSPDAPKKGSGGDSGSGKFDTKSAKKALQKRYEHIDQLDDPVLSEMHRNTGIEPEVRGVVMGAAAANETFSEIFSLFLKILMVIFIICGLIVLYILITSFFGGLRNSVRLWRYQKAMKKPDDEKKKKPKKKKKKKGKRPLLENFGKYADPFYAGSHRTGDELVRYLWEAMIAFCQDFGNPCDKDQTPFEFVESEPAALEGFEESAEYIAGQFSFSEYSGEKVPDEEIPRLKKFWRDLQNHASFLGQNP